MTEQILDKILDKIKHSLQAAEGSYYRLVLLVGESGSGKTSILRKLAKDLGTQVVNVNLALSSELLELTAKQRPLRLPQILDRILGDCHSPAVLDNLEILFGNNLEQDPLRLLQHISRNRAVVASWNGTYTGGRLLYAANGHAEYRNYASADALIVKVKGDDFGASAEI